MSRMGEWDDGGPSRDWVESVEALDDPTLEEYTVKSHSTAGPLTKARVVIFDFD